MKLSGCLAGLTSSRMIFIAAGLAVAGLFPAASITYGLGRETPAQTGSGESATVNYDEAILLCSQLIAGDPENPKNYFERGMIYMLKEDNDKAIADFTTAIKLDPHNAQYFCYRGTAHGSKADAAKTQAEYDLAIADFSQAITLNAQYAEAYYGRGATYAETGAYSKAITDYGQAILYDPKDEEAYNNFAWVLATCPDATLRDGKKAVEYATKACELSEWKECASLDTLAAAYAETGDFTNAVKWESECLQAPNLTAEIATDARNRLVLYQDHKPYHESK